MIKKIILLLIMGLLLSVNSYGKPEPKPIKIIRQTIIKEIPMTDQYKAGVEVRVADTKNMSWHIYYNRGINTNHNEVGVKVVLKLGKSYLEKRIEELQKQIKKEKQ